MPYFGHLVSNDLGDQWTLIQIFDSWMSLPLGFASTITLRTKDHIPCCQCFAFGSMLLTKGVTRGKIPQIIYKIRKWFKYLRNEIPTIQARLNIDGLFSDLL